MLNRQRFVVVLILIVLTLLFFYKLAFTDLILGRGDTYVYFYPYWQARNTALAQGHLPLWTPDLFMGAPLLANPQLGTFYPPNWLTIPFSAPDAIRLSVLVHIAWALLGTYVLARRTIKLDSIPALTASVMFGLGGYMGAHVEQINQLQGLAWLPWLFVLLHGSLIPSVDSGFKPTASFPNFNTILYTLLLAIALALQLFTGHTQTVFISLVGLGMYGLVYAIHAAAKRDLSLRKRVFALLRPFAILGAAGVLAMVLALPQIIPTQELTSVSNRRSGLNPAQATAFSFDPYVLGRGLLPSYDGQLFGEYVAYVGIIGLGLALVGALVQSSALPSVGMGEGTDRPYRVSPRLVWFVIAGVGIVLALGRFNPLYWTLATLPGFNLFRVPARWLALFGLAAGMLAGLGVQALMTRERRIHWLAVVIPAVFIVVLANASALMTFAPAEDISGAAVPTSTTLLAWGAALLIFVALVGARLLANPPPAPLPGAGEKPAADRASLKATFAVVLHRHARLYGIVVLAAMSVELFFAAQILPYNDLTPPEVYRDAAFTTDQMRAYAAQQTPPGRILSISRLLFDPGDRDVLEARYRQQGMDDLTVRLALVDVKRQTLLMPNLPLTWGIPSVDGFDGGLLPTQYYTAFTSLILPPGELRTVDGRLNEILAREDCRGACIPDQRLLNLMNVRYLMTDKVYDLWQDGVAYDTTFEQTLKPGSYLFPGAETFEADQLNILSACSDDSCLIRDAQLIDAKGNAETLQQISQTPLNGMELFSLKASKPIVAKVIYLAHSLTQIRAMTLVDTRTGDFVQLDIDCVQHILPEATHLPETLFRDCWRRALSSDIKVYENPDILPRAFVVSTALYVLDNDLGTEDALSLMRSPDFMPRFTVIISGDKVSSEEDRQKYPLINGNTTSVTSYQPERVEIAVNTDQGGYLLLTDAYYPGWTATVNGQPVPVQRADAMFRAVRIPQGKSTVVFEYRPAWLPLILVIGAAVWLLVSAVTMGVWWRSRGM